MPAPLGCHSSLYTAAPREIVWMNRVLFRLLCATALLAVAVGHLGHKNGDGGVPLVKRRVDKLERKLDNVDESVDALQDLHRQEMIALLNNRVDRLGEKLDDVHDSVNALQDDNDTETAAGEEARPSVNTVGRARLNGLPLLGPNRKQRENSAISMNTKASEIVINDGVRTSICSTGGGVRAMLSMWAILKKFGRSLVAQAPVIATSSGSSWFVNQLLFSKKNFFDDDHAGTGKANAYTFEAAVDNIYSVNSDVENGQDVVSSRAAGHKGSRMLSAAWLNHITGAIYRKDGWNSIVDELNAVAKIGNGIEKAKYDMDWYQSVSLLASGVYESRKYRFCPFANKGRVKDEKTGSLPESGSFRFEDGFCKFCPKGANSCNEVFKKAPVSNVYEYKILIDGKESKYGSIPAYVRRQHTTNEKKGFKVIIPILQQAKKIEIEYGPLYGRSKVVEEKHWKMFKYKDSNQMLEEDKLGIGRYTIHYSDIQKYTAKYYDSLWSHRRERLSAISSSAPGLLNSRRIVEALKPLGTVLHQFFNSDFDGETGLPFKGALHLRKEELKKAFLLYFVTFSTMA